MQESFGKKLCFEFFKSWSFVFGEEKKNHNLLPNLQSPFSPNANFLLVRNQF